MAIKPECKTQDLGDKKTSRADVLRDFRHDLLGDRLVDALSACLEPEAAVNGNLPDHRAGGVQRSTAPFKTFKRSGKTQWDFVKHIRKTEDISSSGIDSILTDFFLTRIVSTLEVLCSITPTNDVAFSETDANIFPADRLALPRLPTIGNRAEKPSRPTRPQAAQ